MDGDYSSDIASAFLTLGTDVAAWASAAIALAVLVGAACLVRKLLASEGGGAWKMDDWNGPSGGGYSYNWAGNLEQEQDLAWHHLADYPEKGNDPDYFEDS